MTNQPTSRTTKELAEIVGTFVARPGLHTGLCSLVGSWSNKCNCGTQAAREALAELVERVGEQRGTCETCKHWDEATRREAQESRATYAAEFPDVKYVSYFTGTCAQIQYDGIELVVYGDGYVEEIETDANFGCNSYEAHYDAKHQRTKP